MKTNGTENNGGMLCGLQGTACASGDWTRAYADYLVQYADFYRAEGIKINKIGFVNEPDWHPSYSSMEVTPAQAAEFLKIIGPAARRAGYQVVCCDSFGWNQSQPFADAISADPQASRELDTFTGHSYASRSDHPLTVAKPVWMSEWAPSTSQDGWNTAWDSGKVTDGIAIAEHIQDTLAQADASGYLYWYGVSQGATAALIQVDPATQTYHVSRRYDAFAAYSRFIKPGAIRIGVQSDAPGVKASAYRNPDGSTVLQLLNLNRTATTSSSNLRGAATAHLTDQDHGLTRAGVVDRRGRITLPPRSLVTVVQPG